MSRFEQATIAEIDRALKCGLVEAEAIASMAQLSRLLDEPYAKHASPEEWADIAIGIWEDAKRPAKVPH